jgi:hypothetical protein
MADDHFLREFLEPGSATKLEKKDSGDLLNSLFDVRPAQPAAKPKPRKEETVHEYLRIADKSSEKMKKIADRIRQEKTNSPFELKAKKEPESKLPRPPSSRTVQTSDGKIGYMPKVVDIFAKSDKD